MMELLHATDTRLGLVTNGNDWMLVDAPKGETTGFITWDATFWAEEPLTLRAFRSLLGVHRFFSVPDDETLEAMLKESASNQQEVTDRLGYQVREAVEEIIRSLDRIDQDEKGQLLAGIPEPDLYEAALTVMMRLVFLFSAEERGLLLLGDPLYDEHYAVSTLVARLQEAADQHGEEVLERRHDAWVRLLSTFRAVYGGVRHERLKLLPYAGQAVRPRPVPVPRRPPAGDDLEGPPTATPLPIDNRTVLHLLRSLQYLEMRGEARRLSFRALDIEQIGHVYEGLLDHTARRAAEPMLSLTAAKGDEPEVALSELERLRAKGEADLLKFLAKGRDGPVGERPQESAGQPGRGGRRQEAPGGVRRRGAVQPGAALLGAGPQRHVRPAGGDPQGLGLRHGGDGSAVQRHALHAPQPDRADRPVHAGAPGLRRPGRGEAEGGVDAPTGQGTARPEGLRHGVRLGGVPRPGLPLPVRAAGRGVGGRREAAPRRAGDHARGDGLDRGGAGATDPQGHERAAGLRPAHRGPAVPVRRGQEPARRRDGQAVDLAADPGQGQAVHVPRPRHPVRRFAGRHQQRDAVEDLLARRSGDRDHAAELPRHDPEDHGGDPAAAGPTGEDRRRHGRATSRRRSGSSPTSGSRPSGSTTPPTACWPRAGNRPSRPSESAC